MPVSITVTSSGEISQAASRIPSTVAALQSSRRRQLSAVTCWRWRATHATPPPSTADGLEIRHFWGRYPRPGDIWHLDEVAHQNRRRTQLPLMLIDSFTMQWRGTGGVLDWEEEELARMAGDDWKEARAGQVSLRRSSRAWRIRRWSTACLQRRIPSIRGEETLKPRESAGDKPVKIFKSLSARRVFRSR